MIVTVTAITSLNRLMMNLDDEQFYINDTKSSNDALPFMSNVQLMNYRAATNFQSHIVSQCHNPTTEPITVSREH